MAALASPRSRPENRCVFFSSPSTPPPLLAPRLSRIPPPSLLSILSLSSTLSLLRPTAAQLPPGGAVLFVSPDVALPGLARFSPLPSGLLLSTSHLRTPFLPCPTPTSPLSLSQVRLVRLDSKESSSWLGGGLHGNGGLVDPRGETIGITPLLGKGGGGYGFVNYLAPTPRSRDPTIRREDGQQGKAIKVLFFWGGGITVRDEVLKRPGENTLQPQRGGATGALQGCVLPSVGVQEP